MKLLNKNNLSVRFAAAKEESRYTLRAILATENETVATDGHVLCRVSMPNQNPSHFPSVDGFKPNGFTRGLIPVDVAKTIESAIPKSKNLPILQHAAITTEHIEDREVIKVLTTDLENPKVFTVRPIEGQFPAWDSDSLWSTDAPVIDISFDARLLAAIAGAAAKFSDNERMAPVRLRLYGNSAAMRFDVVNDDGQEMNGLIMPCRATVSPTFKEKKAVQPEPEPEPEPEQSTTKENTAEDSPQCFTCGYIGEEIAACTTCREPICPQCIEEKRHSHEPEPEPLTLQQAAGSGRLVIGQGWGYYDVSQYPYGGDFRRAAGDVAVSEVVRELGNPRQEFEVLLHDGHTAIVRRTALLIIGAN